GRDGPRKPLGDGNRTPRAGRGVEYSGRAADQFQPTRSIILMASAWRSPATSTGMVSALKLPQAATSSDGLTFGLAGNSWLMSANRLCASSVGIHSTMALAASGCGAYL